MRNCAGRQERHESVDFGSALPLALFWGFAVFVLVAGFGAGFGWTTHFLPLMAPSIRHIQHIAATLGPHRPVLQSIFVIFLNNTRIALMMVILGVFAGIFPAYALWSNGLLMGVITHLVSQRAHVAWWKVLLYGELPHGVFELGALTLAGGIGIRLGALLVFSAVRRVSRQKLTPNATNGLVIDPATRRQAASDLLDGQAATLSSVSVYREFRRLLATLPSIVAILWIAACIEILVTPHLIHALLLGGAR